MIRDWEPSVLAPRERRAVLAFAAALYDPEGHSANDPELGFGELADDVGRWLGGPNATMRGFFRALLALLELSPVRFGHGPRTMSSLPLPARVAYLASLDAAGALSLETWKAILGMAYFGSARGAERMNLDAVPPPRLVRRSAGGHTKASLADVPVSTFKVAS